ncbi:hypothetical protein [Vulcanisaeta sp. JCM 16159]|uniref:hypothetical protein n=1 Tax=Vulcanisaeta sp. JCM 16159 TaxID=1295371 RepID=UPI0006D1F5B7|nr:hypothetical protein [Vulcanisaeta sp. JCM 16159]
MSSGQCPPGFVWSEKLNKCMKSWDDIPEKKTSLAEVLGLPEGNNNQSNKEVKPEAKNEAKAESKPETKLEVKSEEFIAIGKVDGVEVKVKVNDPNYVCYGDRCGWVHYSEINDIMNTLNVPRPIAEGIAKAVTRYLLRSNNLFRECVSKAYIYNKKTGEYEEDCVKEVYVEIRGEHKVEVFLVRYGEEREVHEPIAVLPRRIIEYHDLFMDNTYYLFTDDAGRLHVVIDKNEIVNELRNAGFIIERLSYEVQVAIENLTIRDSGYLMPGITEEGIIDPTQRLAELLGLSNLKTLTLDLNDYGIESLAAIHDFVMSHYPGDNKWRALANVALVLGKVVSPVVRKRNRTFIDSLIWNYGRGGEGKTTLVEYVLAPLLGITDEYNANYFVIIKGSVRSYQQFRNLISLNRLPLILDEQTERALANNAELIIEATVGSGIIGVHAAKYGLGIGAKFMSSRGVVVFTNVPFSRFLKKVQELASEFAYVRRVVVINWVHELPNFTTDELHKLYESIKPIYGAINRVWMKYRDELIKARDIFELSKKLLLALGREYAVDNEELVRVIEDYIKALDLVMQEFEGEKPNC